MGELCVICPSILSSSCSFLWPFSRSLLCVLSTRRYLWLNAWLEVPRADPCSAGRSTCPKVFKFFLLGFSLLQLRSLLKLIINSKTGPCVTPMLRVLMTDGDQMVPVDGTINRQVPVTFKSDGGLSVCLSSSRQTQWDPPTWDSPGDDASLEHEAEMDLGTPTYDENPMKVSAGSARETRRSHLLDRLWG